MLTLKSLDIAVLLKVIAAGPQWTAANLAEEMYISPSEISGAFRRTERAKLYDKNRKAVKIPALEEIIFHGLQYIFLGKDGIITRGMPTSIAAPPLVFEHFDEPELPPVWPHAMGTKRGYSIEPLYKRAADAAAADHRFYELLALTDAIREGKPRVKNVATIELQKRFQAYSANTSARWG